MRLKALVKLIQLINNHGCPQFASLTYDAQPKGPRLSLERARHTILLGFSWENLYQKDLEALKALLPGEPDKDRITAIRELIGSVTESLTVGIGNNSGNTNIDTYEHLPCDGLKVHKETGEVHVTGLAVSKVVLIEGTYREVKRRNAVTAAKADIRALLPSSRVRQFNLADSIGMNIDGHTLVFG
jgi:hypothetical protein